jgi:hypothetical protein
MKLLFESDNLDLDEIFIWNSEDLYKILLFHKDTTKWSEKQLIRFYHISSDDFFLKYILQNITTKRFI